MPNYIRQWKINNQIVDLRDGTKGQPNGAVPLGSDGKISYSLAKFNANAIPVSRDNSDSIAKWASDVVGTVKLPTPDTWETIEWLSSACDKIKCYNGIFIATGTFGIRISKDAYSFLPTNVSSWPSSEISIYIYDIVYLGSVYFVLTNIGLWASNNASSWTRVSNSATNSIAYDGTRYVANFYVDGKYLANSTDGFTWTADTFFSSLGSLDLSGHSVYGVWYVDNVWWINAYYSSGNDYSLFFYDGTHFSIPVTVGSILGLKWKAIHRTHNIDGLLQGDVWVIASVGENNQSRIYCSETLYGVEWRQSTTIPGVTTDFIEHKGVLYIGNTSGIAYMDPVGNYWFYTRRLSDVIGQNPCKSLETTGNVLLVCGGTKMLYSIDAIRWYRGISNVACYGLAYFNERVLLACSSQRIIASDVKCDTVLYL